LGFGKDWAFGLLIHGWTAQLENKMMAKILDGLYLRRRVKTAVGEFKLKGEFGEGDSGGAGEGRVEGQAAHYYCKQM
jgi:hypothetical protein